MTTATSPPPPTQVEPGEPPTPSRGSRDLYRPALAGLLVLTAVLYLADLGASGWANSFYAAAAQAGSESWKAFFFGASDAAGSITVDKTPASLWVMGLSVRAFGLSSWSLLVPQALMGVATVALLVTTVRRATGSSGAGLLAGAVMASTPVAALMFRFDNPDALLVLLLVGATAAVLRAVEAPRRALRWLVLAGALVGFAFLTKMLQAFLVLPAFAVVYLLEARVGWGRKVVHLLAALATMVAAAGWWIAAVMLWPGARPYIGGSQTNSILELTLGYNGFGRLTGDETGSVGGAGGWGSTGLLRLVGTEIGGQVAWLLPAALLLLVTGVWLLRRAPWGDPVRAALVVWGGWLVVTALTFSLMAGIFHAYYTVALAPAIAAVTALGAHQLWLRRHASAASLTLAVVVALSTSLSFALLARTPDFLPWLRWAVALLGFGSAVALAFAPHLGERLTRAVASVAVVALLAGPAAYTVDTVTTPHTGSIPSAGPSTGSGGGGPGGGGFPQGMPPTVPGTTGGAGGLLDASTPSAAMAALLTEDADSFTWVAAAIGANTAAGYQLATEDPVMPVGGFNGTDPSPTLAQFQAYVAGGEIHWFIAGGGMGGGMGGPGGGGQDTTSTSSQITSWVESTFTARTVDGVTVYDLTAQGGAA